MDSIESDTTDNIQPKYTLGVISKLSSIPTHSIRQYVDYGLIIPFKSETGRHLFSEIDLIRLKCIKKSLSEYGLNIAGIKALLSLIPCWKIINCSLQSRNLCDAYYSQKYPCWEASHKGNACRNRECRVCSVYRYLENCKNIKSILKTYL